MRRSQRLIPAVDMAKRREDQAAQELASAKQAVIDEKKRGAELDTYYSEYQQLFNGQIQGLRASTIMANREFLQQLSHSCKAQKDLITRTEEVYDAAKRRWHQCYLKHENLKSFVENIAKQEALAADKIEQGLVDEWVTQSCGRK